MSNIHPEFSEKIIFHQISPKSVFPRFPVDFQIFRIMSENSPRISQINGSRTSYPKHFKSYITFRSFPRILRQLRSMRVFRFVHQLDQAGRMVLSCPKTNQLNCEKAGQDEKPLIIASYADYRFTKYDHCNFISET